MLDVVVVDIPTRFGMVLSRSWGEKLGGVLKLDFTYAIIPVFKGEERRLYKETRFVKTTTKKDAGNSPIYSQEKEDIYYFMLHEDEKLAEDTENQLSSAIVHNELYSKKIWKCYFDDAYLKDDIGAGFLLVSPEGNILPFSFKFEFDSTNNVAEYEALILSLRTAKKMGI